MTSPALPVWLHYHVQKTGGQTLRAAFVSQLELGHTYVHLDRGSRADWVNTNERLALLTSVELDRIAVVGGHDTDATTRAILAGRPIREVVVVRSPAERIVSWFNWKVADAISRGSDPLGFDEWYESFERDHQMHFLAERLDVPATPEAVADRLARCEFVGRMEQIDSWLPSLLQQIGLSVKSTPHRNVTGVHHPRILTLDDELETRLRRDNPGDTELMRLLDPILDEHLDRLTERSRGAATITAPAATDPPDVPADGRTGHPLTRIGRQRGARRALQVLAAGVVAATAALALGTRADAALTIAAAAGGLVALVAMALLSSDPPGPDAADPTGDGVSPGFDDLAELARTQRRFGAALIERSDVALARCATIVDDIDRSIGPLAELDEALRLEIATLRRELEQHDPNPAS